MYLKQTDEQVKANIESGHVCWDDNDVIDGKATGAVRVSFGLMNTYEDVFVCACEGAECVRNNEHELPNTDVETG